MDSREQLFLSPDPYDTEGTEEIFIRAVKENILYHQKNCKDYNRILSTAGYNPRNLRSESDLACIPVIPTLYLKKHPACSVPREKLAVVAKSSGTGGLQSKIPIDRKSLFLGMAMAGKIFRFHGLISPLPTNYGILGYKPDPKTAAGAARTLYGATKFAPAAHRAYAVKQGNDGFEPDMDGFIKSLSFYEKALLPVRIMGFPAYLWYLLEFLEGQGLCFRFAPGSKVILGGGWKTSQNHRVSREELFRKTRHYLGIREASCYEFFSAVEHPVSYCCCKNHHFHVPIYSRVIIRDFHTLEPLPYGKPGLLSFVTPLLGSSPCVSVMTDDIGILHEGSSCGCSIKSPYFEILGRAEDTGIKTCAVQAQTHLRGGHV